MQVEVNALNWTVAAMIFRDKVRDGIIIKEKHQGRRDGKLTFRKRKRMWKEVINIRPAESDKRQQTNCINHESIKNTVFNGCVSTEYNHSCNTIDR